MSYHGRLALAAIEDGERRIELRFWRRYAKKLMPAERRRIRDGNFRPLIRPMQPEWTPGEWLRVGPRLHVRVGKTTPQKGGRFRTPITAVRDDRTGGRAVSKRLHEDPQTMTTIVQVNNWPADPPEPERIPDGIVRELPSSVAARARYERERQAERAAYEEQPLEVRLARLQTLADEKGVDVTRQLARIEQGIRQAEKKVRRLAADLPSDRAA